MLRFGCSQRVSCPLDHVLTLDSLSFLLFTVLATIHHPATTTIRRRPLRRRPRPRWKPHRPCAITVLTCYCIHSRRASPEIIVTIVHRFPWWTIPPPTTALLQNPTFSHTCHHGRSNALCLSRGPNERSIVSNSAVVLVPCRRVHWKRRLENTHSLVPFPTSVSRPFRCMNCRICASPCLCW